MSASVDEEEIYSDVKDDQMSCNSIENIYVNKAVCDAVKFNKPGAPISDLEGSNTVKKRTCIATALILGLLCLLLLAGLLILLVLYTKGSDWEMKKSYNNQKEANQFQTKLQALNWTYFAGRRYYISSTVKTWQDSRTYCQRFGTDLVIVNSLEEQNFMQASKLQAWIGMTDLQTKLAWNYWAAREPNNASGAEDCVELVFNGEYWNDAQCNNTDYWIGEWVGE
ncbi:CD209 antigen-like protein E isoform X4 [Betta splendens]|uniref:CD209 antigen-like protein E isoform X4 n=1 Tax=Betta splendens TaxID=158456 RepID=A0A9W2XZB3_BETSP|nr:CD209 antigen-like protein E isoform X4 [Betta splendens]